MGCINKRSIKVYSNSSFNSKPKNINELKRECFNFYKKNPYFKQDINKIKTLITQYKDLYSFNLSNLLEKSSMNSIEKLLFHEIHLNFYTKLNFFDKNQVKSDVLQLIILFLSNDKDISIQESKRLIFKSLILSIDQSKGLYKYNTETLSNLLHLIIQLSLGCMVYMIFSFVLIDKSKYEKIFNLNDPQFDIEKVCLKLMILIEKELYKFNNEITEKAVESICYSYVFKEINDFISNETIISLSEMIIDKVIRSLIVLYSPYNLLDAFFNLSLNHIS